MTNVCANIRIRIDFRTRWRQQAGPYRDIFFFFYPQHRDKWIHYSFDDLDPILHSRHLFFLFFFFVFFSPFSRHIVNTLEIKVIELSEVENI